MFDQVATPKLVQNFDRFVETLATGFKLNPHRLELFPHPARTDPKCETIIAQHAKGRRRLRNFDRVPQPEDVYEGREAQAFGDGSHTRNGDPRVGPRCFGGESIELAVFGVWIFVFVVARIEHMVRNEGPVEANFFTDLRNVYQLVGFRE